MANIYEVEKEVISMAKLADQMLRTTFDGFIKHDLSLLSAVLKKEEKVNNLERGLTLLLIELSKQKQPEKEKGLTTALMDIIGDIEMIGDYCKDLVERIEIKIQEKLLFSQEALEEYTKFYELVETTLVDCIKALETKDKILASKILEARGTTDRLVDEYRQKHVDRLMKGICDPRAGNMFLNMLDFTDDISHHSRKIAKAIVEL